MANPKNEHVSPRVGGWIVRKEGSKNTSRLFENKKDAVEYAGIIAASYGGSVITHKHNGQFNEFRKGNEIYVRTHKIAPIISDTIEITHPIVNDKQLIATIPSI